MSKFLQTAVEIGEVVEQKNAAYGSSFAKAGQFLALLYPAGIAPEQYADALLVVRIFDKLMRIATNRDALGESPYRDIAGYGILGASLHGEPSTTKEHGDAPVPVPALRDEEAGEGHQEQVLQPDVPRCAGEAGAGSGERAAADLRRERPLQAVQKETPGEASGPTTEILTVAPEYAFALMQFESMTGRMAIARRERHGGYTIWTSAGCHSNGAFITKEAALLDALNTVKGERDED